MNQVTDAFRAIDPSVWLRQALRDVDPSSSVPVVFDSMRFRADYAYLTQAGFVTVEVQTPKEVRLSRLTERGQVYDENVDDLHPAEVELAGMHFDYRVRNAGSHADLENEVQELALELGL